MLVERPPTLINEMVAENKVVAVNHLETLGLDRYKNREDFAQVCASTYIPAMLGCTLPW